MQRQSIVSVWCERVIEAGWLLALTLIPIYFNLLSSRHFEPDKATTLRALVILMATAALIYGLERLGGNQNAAPQAEPVAPSNPFAGIWRRLTATPLALPTLLYVLVFLVATAMSVVPRTSFWGSYQRMQGTYTNLSYIGLFVLIALFLRRREQLERLVTVMLLASLAVSGYGLVQHFQLDPLPWRGDVITRVASTMGNSIFVAAYLIMIVPFALYRIAAAIPQMSRAPRASGNSDLLWAVAYAALVVGTLLMLLSVLLFGAVVRVADLRYWWVFPGAIMVCTALWVLPTLRLPQSDRLPSGVTWTAVLTVGYLLLLILTYGLSAGSGAQVVDTQTSSISWSWLLTGSVVLLVISFALMYTLPRGATSASRTSVVLGMIGSAIVLVAALVAIFFTQSRGPWIGAGAGLFVFFSLLLWWAGRQARARDYGALAGRLRLALWSWVAFAVVIGTFLIAFNTIDTPFFTQLREAPYIGRMGKLLETDVGTGLVRRLIWTGDDHAGGAIGLITADPLRTVIGWGPESMFVAFNPFYPPSLANIESRGASPDRSHQALLDELVNKGLLGLLSYLFLLFSFVALCWKLMRRSDEWHWQVFFIACLSVVTCHFVEGLSGIPIVSTLMMFWVTLALAVAGGVLAGHYTIGATSTEKVELDAEPVPAAPQPALQGKGKGRGQAQRGAVARGAAAARGGRRQRQTSPAALAIYSLLLILALGATWWFNLNPVYADMRFQEAQNYSDAPNAGLTEQIIGLDKYLDTIRRDPDEDFYYLNLGRSLMNVADYRRAQGQPMTPPESNTTVAALLQLDNVEAIQQFVLTKTPLTIMSYAQAVLTRAQELNRLNKDHAANLARLNNFWYNWTQDPERLNQAVQWYERANQLAPQDVSIANERASALALLGSYTAQQGDDATAQTYYAQAEQLLSRSKELDARYKDTDGRLADVYRLQRRFDEATAQYLAIIPTNPHQFDTNIDRIATDYKENNQIDQLKQILQAYMDASAKAPQDGLLASVAGLVAVRAGDSEAAVKAYGTAVASAPQRLDYLRNYTLVLSDTRRYTEAAQYGQQALTLTEQQVQAGQADPQEAALLQTLVAYLQQQAASGQ